MPFISPVKSWGGGGNGPRSIEEPLRTTTTSKGGEHAVIVPHVTKFREGAIGSSIETPLPTVTANSYISWRSSNPLRQWRVPGARPARRRRRSAAAYRRGPAQQSRARFRPDAEDGGQR
jgi:hypothetical protein